MTRQPPPVVITPPDKTGRQQILRLPALCHVPIQPGDWIKLKDTAPEGLAGRVVCVRSVTAALVTARGQWVCRISTMDGRSVEWHCVERWVTEEEARTAARLMR